VRWLRTSPAVVGCLLVAIDNRAKAGGSNLMQAPQPVRMCDPSNAPWHSQTSRAVHSHRL